MLAVAGETYFGDRRAASADALALGIVMLKVALARPCEAGAAFAAAGTLLPPPPEHALTARTLETTRAPSAKRDGRWENKETPSHEAPTR
jgi:hypothetical protein